MTGARTTVHRPRKREGPGPEGGRAPGPMSGSVVSEVGCTPPRPPHEDRPNRECRPAHDYQADQVAAREGKCGAALLALWQHRRIPALDVGSHLGRLLTGW